MRKFSSILFGVAALAFAGCEQMENNAPAGNETEFTFTAGIDVDTKLDYSAGATDLKWKASGEKITVFFLDAGNAVVGTETFTQKSVNETGKKATFTGAIPTAAAADIQNAKMLCVYPAIGENESAAGFTYDFTTQTGAYNENCTVMRTAAALNIMNVQAGTEKVAFTHWNYIINATLDFGAEVTGTVSDIVLNNTNVVSKKKYWITDAGAWKAETTKGSITISETKTLADGKANVVIYGFGDNYIGQSEFTCKVEDKEYKGLLSTRSKNCENGHIYNKTINMNEIKQQTVLKLEFTGTSTTPSGMIADWPTSAQGSDVNKTCQIGGNDYTFIIPKGAYIKWSKNLDGTWYIRPTTKKNKVLGLPTVQDKKLVRVDVLNVASANSETDRHTVITDAEGNEISDAILLKGTGYTYSFDTSAKAEKNKVYYIASSSKASGWNGFANVTLYYE